MFLIAVVASAGISVAPMISRPIAPMPVSRPVATRPVARPVPNATAHHPLYVGSLPGHAPIQNAFDCYHLAVIQQTQMACPPLFIRP